MKAFASYIAVVSFVFVATAAFGDENPLVGRWEARDPQGSGETMTFTFTATHIEMAGERPVPYRAERHGNTVRVHVEGDAGAAPAVVTLVSDSEIRMQLPGGPELSMTRVAGAEGGVQAAAPAATPGATEKPKTLVEEMTAALLPHGVPTRFEPLGQSLDQLLGAGWKMVQASGGQGGFAVWLSNGGTQALCMVVPKPFDEAGGALADCRRLN